MCAVARRLRWIGDRIAHEHSIFDKYARCGPTSIDVLELLHAGWAAIELETTNRESLFEICMDMLGYKYRWVQGMDVEDVGVGQPGRFRWVYVLHGRHLLPYRRGGLFRRRQRERGGSCGGRSGGGDRRMTGWGEGVYHAFRSLGRTVSDLFRPAGTLFKSVFAQSVCVLRSDESC